MRATQFLHQDHDEMKDLFAQLGAATDPDLLQSLFDELEQLLIIHTQIEEEIFYPAARNLNSLVDLVDEAIAAHDAVDKLCDELAETEPEDVSFRGRLKALEDTLYNHLAEEENDLFPRMEQGCTETQLEELGRRLEARKAELLEEEFAEV